MGIEAQDQDYPKKLQGYHQHTRIHNQNCKLNKPLFLVIFTNLVTVFIFTGPFSFFNHPLKGHSDLNSLLQELNSTKAQLSASYSLLSELNHRLNSTNLLVQALLIDLASQQDKQSDSLKLGNDDSAMLFASEEVNLALGPHKLPFGYSQRIGSDEIHTTIGAACLRFQEELNQYMTYEIGGECPVDDLLAQRLVLKGCEPLPQRRCRPKSPKNYEQGYCKDCFDLRGREKGRWIFDDGGLDFGIDQVLATKKAGTIRIGLDIGGGTGTFAARMRERDVTIITSAMNLDGPFNNFIASRGLIPMHLSISQRLPFFENTLDIVHSMDVISNWIPDTLLEFILYDIYRVLRPGGLFWLDHFFCFGSQLNRTYETLFERIGFNRLRWRVGMKLDRGVRKNEWYISALLEKPVI